MTNEIRGFVMKRILVITLSIILMFFAFTACNNDNGKPVFEGDSQQVANQLKPADLIKDVLKPGAKGVDVDYELIPDASAASGAKALGDGKYTLRATVTFTEYATGAGTVTGGVLVYDIPGQVSGNSFKAIGSCTITTKVELIVETTSGEASVSIADNKASVGSVSVVLSNNNEVESVSVTVSASTEVTATVEGEPVDVPEETKPTPDPTPTKVNVTLNYGEGIEETVESIVKGSEYTFKEPVAEQIPDGKKFVSWKNGDDEYFSGDSMLIESDITFTAYFVDENASILIGTESYDTLAAAVEAAEDGAIIDVFESIEGSGVQFKSKFTTEGLIINFHGNEYTFVDPTVGSSGTETNGFQLLRDNKITLKNGIVTATTDNAKILFQNYCNLTLDNMVVTAGPSTQYVASNNYGSLNMKNGTTLNAEGGCAFDVYYWPSNSYEEGVRVVILDNTVVINGSIEYGDDGSGDFEDFIANTSLKVPEKYEDIIVISENAKYDYDWSAPDVDGFITLQVSQK